MQKIITLILAFISVQTFAQTTAKVVDSATKDPIPYANILVDNSTALISNAEGFFTVSGDNESSVLVISYLGYAPVQLTLADLKSRQMTVSLQPAVYELDEVNVAERPTAGAIMATVRQNLASNHGPTAAMSKDKVFIRETNGFSPKKFECEITKSTGFSKSALKGINDDIDALMKRLFSKPSRSYTDMLANFYRSPEKKAYKLNVVQATRLLDEKTSASLEGMEGKFAETFLKHLDTTKYYRIKSGWFGSRDTLSLRKDFQMEKKNKAKKTELSSAKSKYISFVVNHNLTHKDFEFIHEPKLYEYTYEGTVYQANGDFAYVISFKPDRNKAIYSGKLYVSQTDFAVLRADYKLEAGKKTEGLNLKLLLGIKFAGNLDSGTLIFKQNPGGKGYHLHYASKEEGQYFYVNRPLKFIELTDEDRDIFAFDLKVEGDNYTKTEYLNMGRDDIADVDFEQAKENEFKYVKLKKYDPSIWKDHAAIEPLQEMKRFVVTEELP